MRHGFYYDGMSDPAEAKALVRPWQERLALTDTEAAEVLHLSNASAIMRAYKNPKSEKAPAPPTLQLMALTATVVDALVLMRTGRSDEARATLQKAISPALQRFVRDAAPGG